MKRLGHAFFIALSSFFLIVFPAFAHVIVTPHQVGIAATQVFDVNVPNEKNNPTVAIKLMIPSGLQDVVPNAKAGWEINVEKKNGAVIAIDWTNGSIPPNERDDFYFSAQVPPKQATLMWKAYQTYAEGTIVSWDVDPAKLENLTDAQQDALADKQNKGEYSITQVIDDLAASTNMKVSVDSASQNAQLAVMISIVALLFSGVSIIFSWKRKKI